MCSPPHPPLAIFLGKKCQDTSAELAGLNLCLESVVAETRLVWRFAYNPAGFSGHLDSGVRQTECPAPAQLLTSAALPPPPPPAPQFSQAGKQWRWYTDMLGLLAWEQG